ncbi:unnamed protein product, partial [Ixodes hexagonus]
MATTPSIYISLWTTVWLGAVVLIVIRVCMWILYRRRHHGLFKRHGIPGPKPSLLIGNWTELKKDRIQVMERWIEQYGSVFGYFVGEIPHMAITDGNLIKECFLKRASVFCDRPHQLVNVEPFKSSLVGLQGQEWKRVRSVLNPIFS